MSNKTKSGKSRYAGRTCSVIGCKIGHQKHYYRFPRDPTLRDIWISFTRRGSDFEIRSSSVICENHFAPANFISKKKQVRITSSAVPTIFYRSTPSGESEKIELAYDSSIQHYSEADQLLLSPAYDKEKQETEMVEKYETRVREVANICRFCLEEQSEVKLVEVSKLKDYSISLDEMYRLMAVKTMRSPFLSQLACEECFQQVITFDGFRKRCRKAQKEAIDEIYELDLRIKKLQGVIIESLMKAETVLDETRSDDDEYQTQERMHEINPHRFEDEMKVKTEVVADDFEEDYMDFSMPECDNESDFGDSNSQIVQTIADSEADETFLNVSPIKVEIQIDDNTDSVIGEKLMDDQLPELVEMQNKVRIYECFFCRMKFASKKIFKAHKCLVKKVSCAYEHCDKMFSSMSGFNTHITRIHKLPKVSRFYCSLCKFSMIVTEDEFKEHRRKCESSSLKKIINNEIECVSCNKVCQNFQAYKIHMMFHQSNLTSAEPEPMDQKKGKAKKRGVFICDSCGREFATVRYLRDHAKRMHKDPSDNLLYTCDICGKTKTSRQILAKHIRNVHANTPSPCKVCGKVFRNKALVQAHMLYHKDAKRIHFCSMCPDKAPYWTAVALKRHQEAHHGYGNGYVCEICCSVFRTKPGLQQHQAASHPCTRS